MNKNLLLNQWVISLRASKVHSATYQVTLRTAFIRLQWSGITFEEASTALLKIPELNWLQQRTEVVRDIWKRAELVLENI